MASTTSSTPQMSATATGTTMDFTWQTNAITWIGVLAAVAIVVIVVLWRCMRARQMHGRATWRSMFVPAKGLEVRCLHLKIEPAPPAPPMRPVSSYLPPPSSMSSRPRARGRQSRRAARGPEIGEGGRRVGNGDAIGEDGASIYSFDDELPAYGGEPRPPVYASVWTQSSGASPPTPSALEAGIDDAQAYEMRSRAGAPATSLPTMPPAARTRSLRHVHRDSVTSVASTSAETIRGGEDEEPPTTPKLKRSSRKDSTETP